MKATDLMIGDWVVNPVHKDKRKIEGVYYDKELHLLVATDGRFPQEYFDPIPLTAEILEKNGFVLNEEDDWFEYENNHRYVLVLFCRELDTDEIQNDSFTIFNGCDCRYVHELQHALRLCGLNDLADNFKV